MTGNCSEADRRRRFVIVRAERAGRLWRIVTVVAVAALPWFAAGPAAASCAAPARDAGGLPRASSTFGVVIVGTVAHVGPAIRRTAGLGDLGYGSVGVFTPVELNVDAILSGTAPSRVVVMNPGGTIAGLTTAVEDIPVFDDGEQWLVVAHLDADGTYQTNSCVGTERLDAQRAATLAATGRHPTVSRSAAGPARQDPTARAPGAHRIDTVWVGVCTALVVALIAVGAWQRSRSGRQYGADQHTR
jgi:hypothetical protein